jgi:adenylosuccinate synthase
MSQKIFVVAGLGYGDEGKGTITDFLVRQYSIENVIRYNGGSQAAHHVVTPEGKTHCFSQFGSGTFVPGVKTFLSKYVAVNPIGIELEEEVLQKSGVTDALDRLIVDEQCPIITPTNVLINQMLEVARGDNRHGSCGKGVGITLSDYEKFGERTLIARDLKSPAIAEEKFMMFWRMRLDQAEQLCDEQPQNAALRKYLSRMRNLNTDLYLERYAQFAQRVKIRSEARTLEAIAEGAVFEGAQGALLDAVHGFFPYVTRSRTTFVNADKLLTKAGCKENAHRIGVTRAYATRHGAGPFVTENPELSNIIPACHNGTNEWQGGFRLGWFDAVTLRYAIAAVGDVGSLAITNIDRLQVLHDVKICRGYKNLTADRITLEEDFVIDEANIIRDIKVRERDEARHRQLTALLSSMEPMYEDITFDRGFHGVRQYTDLIEESCDRGMSVESRGPTAREKRDRFSVFFRSS